MKSIDKLATIFQKVAENGQVIDARNRFSSPEKRVQKKIGERSILIASGIINQINEIFKNTIGTWDTAPEKYFDFYNSVSEKLDQILVELKEIKVEMSLERDIERNIDRIDSITRGLSKLRAMVQGWSKDIKKDMSSERKLPEFQEISEPLNDTANAEDWED